MMNLSSESGQSGNTSFKMVHECISKMLPQSQVEKVRSVSHTTPRSPGAGGREVVSRLNNTEHAKVG